MCINDETLSKCPEILQVARIYAANCRWVGEMGRDEYTTERANRNESVTTRPDRDLRSRHRAAAFRAPPGPQTFFLIRIKHLEIGAGFLA